MQRQTVQLEREKWEGRRGLLDCLVPLNSRVFVFLYLFVLHLLYNYVYMRIAPLYGYLYNFRLDYCGIEKAILITIPCVLFLSHFFYCQLKRSHPSDLFVSLFVVLYYLPGLTLYIYGNWSDSYMLFFVFSILFMVGANELSFIGRRKMPPLPSATYKERLPGLVYWVSILISLCVILIVFVYFGINLKIDFFNLYGLRERIDTSGMPNFFNYYLPFAARITPVLILINVKNRNIIPCVMLVLSQLVSFSYSGMKYTLMALLLVLPFVVLGNRMTYRKVFGFYFLLCVLAAIEIAVTEDTYRPLIGSVLIRRVSFVSTQIGYYYFEFFNNHDYLFYSESFLRYFLEFPYQNSIPETIGRYAFNSQHVSANAGLLSEGFSQIGWSALLVYPVAYVLVFRIVGNVVLPFISLNMNYVSLFIVLLYSVSFIDGTLQSVLLTQGLLFVLCTLVLLYRRMRLVL